MLKTILKRIPGVSTAYHFARRYYVSRMSAEKIFTDIYRKKCWLGVGSDDLTQMQRIIEKLLGLFTRWNIKTVLDIPCGDFWWMRQVPLGDVQYLGADIVGDLITLNRKKYETTKVSFSVMNLVAQELPQVDLIICRDCLVHFSYSDIFRALRNICNSGSKHLLTTTFYDRNLNRDIVTGEWRPLNLGISPLNFPPSLELIVEGNTEGNGAYKDKSLALWRISDIKRQSFGLKNKQLS